MESRGVSSMEQIRVGVISARGQNKVFLAEIGVILKKKFLLQLLCKRLFRDIVACILNC